MKNSNVRTSGAPGTDPFAPILGLLNGGRQHVPPDAVVLDNLFALLDRVPGLAMISDLGGALLYMNATGRDLLGLAQGPSLAGQTILHHYSEQSLELIRDQAIPTAVRDGSWRGEATLQGCDGHAIPVSQVIVFHRMSGAHGGLLSSVAWDISEQKEHERNLWHQATHDTLTGLPNQALLLDRLTQVVQAADRSAHFTAVLLMDVDEFKAINDGFGHEIGNQILVELAVRMDSCVRPGDTVGRYGGDEFVFILCDLNDSDEVSVVLQRIQASLARPFCVGGRDFHVSVSVGAAVHPDDGDDAGTLLHHADMAMYRAKKSHVARRQAITRWLPGRIGSVVARSVGIRQ